MERKRARFLYAAWPSLRRERSRKIRATRLVTSTKAMSTNAAAHAWAFRFLSGDSEYWKIVTGIDGVESDGCQLTSWPAMAHVKRSGAVSPAARATASAVPVTMPPIAVGRITLMTVRHFETPSA